MMSRQRLIQLPLVGAVLLCLLAGVYLVAWKRFGKPGPTKIIKHTVDTHSNDALKYWTTDKMRDAKAVPLPNVKDIKRGKPHSRRPPHTSRPQHS
jgi:hypothetical protein